MKKIYVLTLFFLFLCFGSACQSKTLTLDDVMSVLYDIEVDYRRIAAYQTFPDFEGDDNEILSFKYPLGVYLHKSNNYQFSDYKLFINTHYFYDTRSMRRIQHNSAILTFDDFKPLLNEHLTVIDFDLLNMTALLSLLASCETPLTYSVHRQTYELRGVLKVNDSDSSLYKSINLTFSKDKLLNLSIRYEQGFASTKQTSNYLYGTHYDFSDFFDVEFPELDLFTP